MTSISTNGFEANDHYIWHNYSAPAMTEEEITEMRWWAKTQIVYVFTSKNKEASLAQTVAERWSASERNFSGRPLEWY